MRTFFATALITSTMLITPLALAQAERDQQQDRHGMHSQGHSQHNMMGNGQMQEHMNQMTETMDRIQGTSDSAEREELLEQHRQQMHQTMGSMCARMENRGGSEDEHGDNAMGMGRDMHGEKMREDMAMMRSVMAQMEAHMKVKQSMQEE